MGLSLFSRCSSNPSEPAAIAPNPNPNRWTLLERKEYANAYVLKVRYQGCTNFEGVKIMVFEGKYRYQNSLDPHFSESYSPIARFKPTKRGWNLACGLAQIL